MLWLSKQCLTIVEISTKRQQLHELFRVWKHDILTKTSFNTSYCKPKLGCEKTWGRKSIRPREEMKPKAKDNDVQIVSQAIKKWSK